MKGELVGGRGGNKEEKETGRVDVRENNQYEKDSVKTHSVFLHEGSIRVEQCKS